MKELTGREPEPPSGQLQYILFRLGEFPFLSAFFALLRLAAPLFRKAALAFPCRHFVHLLSFCLLRIDKRIIRAVRYVSSQRFQCQGRASAGDVNPFFGYDIACE